MLRCSRRCHFCNAALPEPSRFLQWLKRPPKNSVVGAERFRLECPACGGYNGFDERSQTGYDARWPAVFAARSGRASRAQRSQPSNIHGATAIGVRERKRTNRVHELGLDMSNDSFAVSDSRAVLCGSCLRNLERWRLARAALSLDDEADQRSKEKAWARSRVLAEDRARLEDELAAIDAAYALCPRCVQAVESRLAQVDVAVRKWFVLQRLEASQQERLHGEFSRGLGRMSRSQSRQGTLRRAVWQPNKRRMDGVDQKSPPAVIHEAFDRRRWSMRQSLGGHTRVWMATMGCSAAVLGWVLWRLHRVGFPGWHGNRPEWMSLLPQDGGWLVQQTQSIHAAANRLYLHMLQRWTKLEPLVFSFATPVSAGIMMLVSTFCWMLCRWFGNRDRCSSNTGHDHADWPEVRLASAFQQRLHLPALSAEQARRGEGMAARHPTLITSPFLRRSSSGRNALDVDSYQSRKRSRPRWIIAAFRRRLGQLVAAGWTQLYNRLMPRLSGHVGSLLLGWDRFDAVRFALILFHLTEAAMPQSLLRTLRWPLTSPLIYLLLLSCSLFNLFYHGRVSISTRKRTVSPRNDRMANAAMEERVLPLYEATEPYDSMQLSTRVFRPQPDDLSASQGERFSNSRSSGLTSPTAHGASCEACSLTSPLSSRPDLINVALLVLHGTLYVDALKRLARGLVAREWFRVSYTCGDWLWQRFRKLLRLDILSLVLLLVLIRRQRLLQPRSAASSL
ncbi:hypothetical protein CCYA_CCYA05G1687 [Cyanidiococcus yangmingshanensis]|nr:hypothetical protein CCYA_CCYA05G1687 [Cyanidiococcus yangmingshanensis]